MARGINLPTQLQGTNPTCRLKIIIIINLLQRKPKEWGHPKQDHYRNCSLCGYSNHRATDCRNIRHDAGNIKQIIPTRGTRIACPNHIKTHLQHPPPPPIVMPIQITSWHLKQHEAKADISNSSNQKPSNKKINKNQSEPKSHIVTASDKNKNLDQTQINLIELVTGSQEISVTAYMVDSQPRNCIAINNENCKLG